MKKFMKNNKKGFTLVELIVVLVILAILAALLIPALTGYIDKAKEKNAIAETRQCVMAAQTLVDEKSVNTAIGTYYNTITDDDVDDILKLAEAKSTCVLDKDDIKVDKNGKIYALNFQASNGKYCLYVAEPDGTTITSNYTVSTTKNTTPTPAP